MKKADKNQAWLYRLVGKLNWEGENFFGSLQFFQKLVDFPGFEPETPIIGFSQWSVTNCEFTIKSAACCGKIKSPY